MLCSACAVHYTHGTRGAPNCQAGGSEDAGSDAGGSVRGSSIISVSGVEQRDSGGGPLSPFWAQKAAEAEAQAEAAEVEGEEGEEADLYALGGLELPTPLAPAPGRFEEVGAEGGGAERADARLRAAVQAAVRAELGSEGGDEPLKLRLDTVQERLCGLEASLEHERARAQWATAAAGVATAAALVACVVVMRY